MKILHSVNNSIEKELKGRGIAVQTSKKMAEDARNVMSLNRNVNSKS
jgi:hypothetical protein